MILFAIICRTLVRIIYKDGCPHSFMSDQPGVHALLCRRAVMGPGHDRDCPVV